jgi:hypothetical protein
MVKFPQWLNICDGIVQEPYLCSRMPIEPEWVKPEENNGRDHDLVVSDKTKMPLIA